MRAFLLPCLFALAAVGCAPVELPPPAAPSRTVPEGAEQPLAPAPEGKGRVLLEANGERARVVEVASGSVSSNGYAFSFLAQRPVCAATPCVVDVDRGPHRFVFVSPDDPNHGGVAEVDVGAHPKVVRHAMGEVVEHPALTSFGRAGMTVGAIGVLTGGALLVGGLLSNAANDSLGNESTSKMVPAGGAILGVSAGVLALGVTFAILGRPEVRRGTTTEWNVETRGREPTNDAGTHVRFGASPSGLGVVF